MPQKPTLSPKVGLATWRLRHQLSCRPGSGNQGVHVHAHSLQPCPDSATPRTAARQAPLSKGFSRQEHWSGLPSPPPGDLPHPGTGPEFPALAGGFFTIRASWEAKMSTSGVSGSAPRHPRGTRRVGPWIPGGAGLWRFAQKMSWATASGAGSR